MSSAKELLAKKLQQNTQKHTDAQKEQFTHGKEFRRNIKLSEIVPSPNQPRKVFDDTELHSLADSINEIGLLQPISVRRIQNGYELISGERRLKAHQLLLKTNIDAIIIDASDDDVALLTLAENLKREDLSDYEIYLGLSSLNEAIKKNKTKLAKSLGMNREDMYKYLSFEKLPIYMTLDLSNQPKLIGRTVATEIKKYLAHYSSKESDNILEETWNFFRKGKCEQTKIISIAEKKLVKKPKEIKSANTITSDIKYGNKKIGRILFNNNILKVNLDINSVSEKDIANIEDFFQELLKNKKV
ncbi:ParB/RepB/Spo0J family partition protein [Acinetobacter nectaris]|uniref:ParB/RepB/Spo0J family partition protein n=1 Tax=Acinetobacter nectaris TaxID=1219382 RepID=UPI001EFF894A|nr:ParB/RepB/Spo0J family partition protein [Acinetobacter nectaris]MCF9035112.1 ParB/RepB/Spo0J family partition protein [Acinetobacter nectaris]